MNHVQLCILTFKNAVDNVNHNILLCKITSFNIHWKCINWLKSYLCPRTHAVKKSSLVMFKWFFGWFWCCYSKIRTQGLTSLRFSKYLYICPLYFLLIICLLFLIILLTFFYLPTIVVVIGSSFVFNFVIKFTVNA